MTYFSGITLILSLYLCGFVRTHQDMCVFLLYCKHPFDVPFVFHYVYGEMRDVIMVFTVASLSCGSDYSFFV